MITAMSAKIEQLQAIMQRLLSPTGCPWDRAQTLHSLRHHTIEEAYELCAAVESGERSAVIDELGDLLFHVVFYCAVSKEFDLDDVVDAITAKLIRRHPHVFADGNARTRAEVARRWDEIKREERGTPAGAPGSILDDIGTALPALIRGRKLTGRAARVGFDWPSVKGALVKVHEELTELEAAIAERGDEPTVEEQVHCEAELGDLLLAVVNTGRHLDADPEAALSGANRRFEERFREIERRLATTGRTPVDLSLEELDALWEQVKRELRSAVDRR
jgi:ATP diphosphatase